MSHFTVVRTRMVELEFLKRALTDLGYQFEEGEVSIRGFMGRKTSAQLRVAGSNWGYDIGFRKSSNGYEVVADWWGVKGVQQQEFVQQISQRYAYHAAREKLEQQGFSIVSEELVKGRIHLRLRRMA
jgi:hypothetical protein